MPFLRTIFSWRFGNIFLWQPLGQLLLDFFRSFAVCQIMEFHQIGAMVIEFSEFRGSVGLLPLGVAVVVRPHGIAHRVATGILTESRALPAVR